MKPLNFTINNNHVSLFDIIKKLAETDGTASERVELDSPITTGVLYQLTKYNKIVKDFNSMLDDYEIKMYVENHTNSICFIKRKKEEKK